MGLDDMLNQAKDAIKDTPVADAAKDGVDKAKEAVQEKVPDQADGAVEQAAEAVKRQF